MGFHQGGGRGKKFGKKDFGKRSFGSRDSARPTMHQAICSECNKECEVPFKPHGDKPVYCRNCFKSKGDMGPREFGKRDYGERDSGGKTAGGGITREQFEILNSKLDQILDAL